MANNAAADTDDAVVEIRQFAEQRLRNEFPYMKTATLEKMLDKAATAFQQDIDEQYVAVRSLLSHNSHKLTSNYIDT